MDQREHKDDSEHTTGDTLPEFPWVQRQRVLSRGIRPKAEMLSPEGFKRQEIACIANHTGKRQQDAIDCIVIYDRSYVVERLARDWGQVLTAIDRSDVLKLITEAKQRYREIEGEQ